MAPTTLYETRAEATHLALKKALEAKLQTFEGGDLDGVQFVTNADLLDVFAEPLPPPNERSAEVTTPARISVLGLCPNCGQGSYLSIFVQPVLTIESTGRSLKLSAKSKAVNHVCGQQTLPEGEVKGQESFELTDIVRPEDALTDEEREADEIAEDTGPLLDDAPLPDEPASTDLLEDDGSDLLPE